MSPDDDNKESTTISNKNKHNSASKGVAMSFGFKKRPTTAPSVLTSPNANAARRLANPDVIDSNGNDRKSDDTKGLIKHAQPTGRSTPRLPPPKKEGIASQRVSRFGFRQPQLNRLNKVADLNSEPVQFASSNNAALQKPMPSNTIPLSNKFKPSAVSGVVGGGTSTTGVIGVDNNRNRTSAVKTTLQTNQIAKYTFQSNQLPKPQPVQVMETKTAKTLANTSMKYANASFRRSSPEDSSKEGSLTEDSGVGSHNGTDENASFSPANGKYKQRNLEIMLNGNTFDVRDIDDSVEVPLPKLPCVFQDTPDRNSVFQNTGVVRERTKEYERQLDEEMRRKISVSSSEGFSDTPCQNYNLLHKQQFNSQKSFIKPKPTPVKTFLESKYVDNKGYSSSASSDEHEWAFGGEAMADEVSLSIGSSDESKKKDFEGVPLSRNVALTNSPLKRPILPLKTEFKNVTLSIADANLEAVAAASKDTLLDEETSPIDSLLSFSTSDEVVKKFNHSAIESKDTNDKISGSSPGTPTNASNSLSLSEGKDDFLIDDEIADQPALVFGDKSQHNSETTLVESTPRARRRKLRNFEGSPLILKDKRNLRSSTVSLDTLSPCESIASDDLMMDYDYSQSSGLEECDKLEKRNGATDQRIDEMMATISSVETELQNSEKLRDWSALLNYSTDRNLISNSKPRFLRSRTATPNSISDSPSSLDGRTNGRSRISATSSPLRRLAHASSLGYDSDDSVIKLDRATHAAIKNDIVSFKTTLLKLRRVLNEQTNEGSLLMSETRNPFESQLNGNFNGFGSEANSCSETEEDSGRLELSDLRRQIIFLQGQLEDKDKMVQTLQEQMTKICVDNYLSNSAPASTVSTDREMCNAATQTERVRPLSVGPTSSNCSPTESTPGSFVSATELSKRPKTSARADSSLQKTPTRERRKCVDPASTPPKSMNNSTSIPRRSESRNRPAPSSLT